MGFEACHPAVNFIFFASVLWGTVSFQHPVFLAIAWLCAFAYSVRRAGRKAVIFNLFLLPLIVIFPVFFGIDGVMYAGPIADTSAFVLAVVFARRELGVMKAAEQNA